MGNATMQIVKVGPGDDQEPEAHTAQPCGYRKAV